MDWPRRWDSRGSVLGLAKERGVREISPWTG